MPCYGSQEQILHTSLAHDLDNKPSNTQAAALYASHLLQRQDFHHHSIPHHMEHTKGPGEKNVRTGEEYIRMKVVVGIGG